LRPTTVLRGGYRVFTGFLGQRRSDVLQTGFSRQTDFQITNNGFLTPVATLANPLPTGQLFPVLGAGQGLETGIDTGLSFFNGTPQVPYMQRWQLGVQQTIAGGFLLELGYIGNRGTRIETNRDLNAISNSFLNGDLTRAAAKVANKSEERRVGERMRVREPEESVSGAGAGFGAEVECGNNAVSRRAVAAGAAIWLTDDYDEPGIQLVPFVASADGAPIFEGLYGAGELYVLQVHGGDGLYECGRCQAGRGDF